MPLRDLTVRELVKELVSQEDLDATVSLRIGNGEPVTVNSVDNDETGAVTISGGDEDEAVTNG